MSEPKKQDIGTIAWTDLTVPDAKAVRDFYMDVIGWKSAPVSMGEYDDFNMMLPGGDTPQAGVCHKRGMNAELPSQWLNYFVVADLDASIAACKQHGGKVLAGPKDMGDQGRYCVIQDPAGAVCALWQYA